MISPIPFSLWVTPIFPLHSCAAKRSANSEERTSAAWWNRQVDFPQGCAFSVLDLEGISDPKFHRFLLLCFCPFVTIYKGVLIHSYRILFMYIYIFINQVSCNDSPWITNNRHPSPGSLKFGRQLNDLLIARKGTCPNKRYDRSHTKPPTDYEENPLVFCSK